MSNFDLNEILPFVLFWIPWVMAVMELHSHFAKGYMREYLRKSSEDEREATRRTTAAMHPISYRFLLSSYLAIALAVPALTVYVILQH